MNSLMLRIAGNLFLALAIAALFGAPARADDAAGTFKTKCAMCHGPDGSGNTATGKALQVRDLSSAGVQGQSDAQLIDIVTNGKAKMPAYKGKLTDAQIKGLVAYIRSLAKK
ncbi:MAG: cytochrome c [Candidatus Acidiferrales bacterium]